MIKNFSDHSANERTFLAWVRTAVAVIAFGFVVERFNLFLRLAGVQLGVPAAVHKAPSFGGVAGLALMVLGLGVMLTAAVRFFRTAKKIDDPQEQARPGTRLDVALEALLLLLGVSLFVYVAIGLLQSQ